MQQEEKDSNLKFEKTEGEMIENGKESSNKMELWVGHLCNELKVV